MKIQHGAIYGVAWFLGVLIFACSTAAQAEPKEKLPDGVQFKALEVFPTAIDLTHRYAYRQLVRTLSYTTGERVDVTRSAQVDSPANLVSLSPEGLVRPAPNVNGAGELVVSVGGKSARIPLKVNTQTERPVSYIQDIMPILGKAGCNAGTCHGAQQGKNGFQLSLRGYDPLFDYQALTDDLAGRRMNRSAPAQSLMLLKPAGEVPHQGGVVLKRGESHYQMLKEWIATGVKYDGESPRVTHIELFPQNPLLPDVGDRQQMVVLAHYADGSMRDVTVEAFLESSLAEVVTANPAGLARAERRGEAAILARYEGAYAATTITVMGDRRGYEWQPVPENNYVDTLVYQKLRRVKILPSELCSDADFIRRIYLDLTGLPPTPEAVREFLNDKQPTQAKRDALIDQLVGNAEFVEHWSNKWADLLQVNRKYLGEKGTWGFRNWIRQAVASNMPYNEFAYSVLTASGSSHENPPAGYFRVATDPGDMAENITHVFLAIRFNCNKCHDHPFERWNQTQYYQFAAFFAQVARKKGPGEEEEVVFDRGGGEVKHLRTGEVTPPVVPYQADLFSTDGPRREQLARWITSPENQYFATSHVNRIWSYLLGLGIIDPIDDIRAGNPPSNPELLERLTKEFVASGFDTQALMRTICKSRTYQHSIQTHRWNEDDNINFSHGMPKRLTAEMLLDAIYQTTGANLQFPGLPKGFRAAQLPDSSVKIKGDFLDLFGRPPRESPCECDRASGVVLGQIQNLINGPVVGDAIMAPNNRLAELVKANKDDRKLVEEIFLAFLSKLPTPAELEAGVEAVQSGGSEAELAKSDLADYEKNVLPQRLAAWEKNVNLETVWNVLTPVEMKSAGGATLARQEDGSITVTGTNPERDTLTLAFTTDQKAITGLRLEVLPDPALAAQGPGRAANGNFVLHELTLTAAPAATPQQAVSVSLKNATADFSQDGWPVASAIDGNPGSGWAVSPEFGKAHTAIFETGGDVGEGATRLEFSLSQQYGSQHTIGRLRISATVSPRPLGSKSTLPAPVIAALGIAAEKRTPEQLTAIRQFYLTQDSQYQQLSQMAARAAQNSDPRLLGAQDLSWALINSPAFLFNR